MLYYLLQGGMRAVMWTDVVQVFLMFAGMIGIIVKGSIDHGGFGNIWNIMADGKRIDFYELVINRLFPIVITLVVLCFRY